MAETYFAVCPDCKHSWICHLGILKDDSARCNHNATTVCACQRRPPRYYVYDKDPEIIKDGLTLTHFLVSTTPDGGQRGTESMVMRIVDALNLLDGCERETTRMQLSDDAVG